MRPRGTLSRNSMRSLVLLALGLGARVEAQEDGRVWRAELEPHWFENGARFWYRNDAPAGAREFVVVDARTGERRPAFDHDAVARALGEPARAEALPVEELEFSADGASVELRGAERAWSWSFERGELRALDPENGVATGLPPLKALRASRGGGRDSAILFRNRTEEAVELCWVDPAGKRRSYGELAPGAERRQHTFARHVWLVVDAAGEPLAAFEAAARERVAEIDGRTPRPQERAPRDEDAPTSVPSPDESLEAFVDGHDLWIRDAQGATRRLTHDGSAANTFHRDAVRARAVGLDYEREDWPSSLPEVVWSPDSTKLLAIQTAVAPEPRVHLVVTSPESGSRPEATSYPYIKPGEPIPKRRPRLFDAATGRELALDTSLCPEPWSLGRIEWAPDASRLWMLYNERGHQLLRVLCVTPLAASARVDVVVEERSETFVDYSSKTFLELLPATNELLWASERDGWNHLYLYDLERGAVKNRVTQGEWVVRRVDRVDADARQIWFRAVGIRPEQDPYHVHLCRVDFDGSDLVVLTEGDGTHAAQWSPDRAVFVDTWSRVDEPPVHELRRARDGALLCELERADASERIAEVGSLPLRFVAKGRDGTTDIWGLLHRPRDFDPARRYPVIENIYAGPHDQHVPKAFRANYRHQRELADRGFVVAQIDGMGTNWRSKAFHDVAWKNLADAGFPDRIAWLRAAAERYPWIDLSRVGIYGGSAGGQNAMRAVLDHADFYRAAAADCGCHDNRMDKIWWNEAWMGWPVDESYAKSSNVVDAHRLGGALLLTVGELDRNVDPASTYRVVRALQEAGKPFEFMTFIGAGHGACESDYGRRLRADFFARHLLGATD